MNSHDPTDLVAHEGEHEAKKDQARREAQQALEDWKWLLSNKRGRRIVWWLLGITGVYRSSFTGNSHTFFNEGARNIGLQVLEQVTTHAPERWLEMMQESRK